MTGSLIASLESNGVRIQPWLNILFQINRVSLSASYAVSSTSSSKFQAYILKLGFGLERRGYQKLLHERGYRDAQLRRSRRGAAITTSNKIHLPTPEFQQRSKADPRSWMSSVNEMLVSRDHVAARRVLSFCAAERGRPADVESQQCRKQQ